MDGSSPGADSTLELIEQSIANARSALSRRMVSRNEAPAEEAPARPHMSQSRRREILAQLAQERIESRGFASAREQALTRELADSRPADSVSPRPRQASPPRASTTGSSAIKARASSYTKARSPPRASPPPAARRRSPAGGELPAARNNDGDDMMADVLASRMMELRREDLPEDVFLASDLFAEEAAAPRPGRVSPPHRATAPVDSPSTATMAPIGTHAEATRRDHDHDHDNDDNDHDAARNPAGSQHADASRGEDRQRIVARLLAERRARLRSDRARSATSGNVTDLLPAYSTAVAAANAAALAVTKSAVASRGPPRTSPRSQVASRAAATPALPPSGLASTTSQSPTPPPPPVAAPVSTSRRDSPAVEPARPVTVSGVGPTSRPRSLRELSSGLARSGLTASSTTGRASGVSGAMPAPSSTTAAPSAVMASVPPQPPQASSSSSGVSRFAPGHTAATHGRTSAGSPGSLGVSPPARSPLSGRSRSAVTAPVGSVTARTQGAMASVSRGPGVSPPVLPARSGPTRASQRATVAPRSGESAASRPAKAPSSRRDARAQDAVDEKSDSDSPRRKHAEFDDDNDDGDFDKDDGYGDRYTGYDASHHELGDEDVDWSPAGRGSQTSRPGVESDRLTSSAVRLQQQQRRRRPPSHGTTSHAAAWGGLRSPVSTTSSDGSPAVRGSPAGKAGRRGAAPSDHTSGVRRSTSIAGGVPVWQRLYKEKDRADEALERARKEQEDKALAECTFQPAVRSRSRAAERPTRADSSLPVSERLHREASRRRALRERASREKANAEMATLTFHPTTNAASASASLDTMDPRPLHERIEDLQRAKEMATHRARLELAKSDKDLTFQPKISRRSEAMVMQHRMGSSTDASASDVTERLMAEARRAEERLQRKRQAYAEAEAASMTFEPSINSSSAQMMAENPALAVDFLERQREFLRAKEQKGAKLRAEADAQNDCTFHPRSGNASEVLALTRPEQSLETSRERVERLAVRDKERADKLKEAIRDEYYAQFRFKPEINPVSRHIGRAHTVDEHVADARRREALERAQREAEEAVARDCTFRPALANPERVLRRAVSRGAERAPFRIAASSDPDGVGDRISRLMHEKQEKLERARRAQEYQELEECTFEPKAAAPPVKQPSGPVVVRGLGRHLEQRERAQRKADDQRRREDEAFRVRGVPRYRAPGEPTVPEPFHLETDLNPRRVQRLERERAEAEAAAARECTFQPDIGSHLSREAVKALLED